MDDEIIGDLCQKSALCHISLLFAGIALVIRDDLSIDELFEGLFDVLVSFDFQRKWVEGLESFVDCLAVGADSLVACLTSEDIFKDSFERSWFERCFDLVEEQIQEFLGILLD